MNVQAAAMSIRDVNLAVVVVGLDLVDNPGEADMAIGTLEPVFGGVPVVLMAQTENGSPRYYGDRETVELLRGIPIDQMPWKEYSTG